MNPFRLHARTRAAPIARSRAVSPLSAASPAPCPVPWRVVRRAESGAVEVEHLGDGPLHSVRFALAGDGLLGLSLPRTVFPGERLSVRVRGAEAAQACAAADAMLVLRWFRPDGEELLWPIAL